MKSIENTDEILKIVKSMIMKQLNLPSENVLDGKSIYGAMLQKRLDNEIFNTFDRNDCIVVMDISESLDYDEDVIPEDNLIYQSIICHLYIYGNNSALMSKMLKFRALSQKNKYELNSQGLHLYKIIGPIDIDEFINNTMYHRKDLELHFSFKTTIENVDDFEIYENTNILNTFKI